MTNEIEKVIKEFDALLTEKKVSVPNEIDFAVTQLRNNFGTFPELEQVKAFIAKSKGETDDEVSEEKEDGEPNEAVGTPDNAGETDEPEEKDTDND